MDSNRIGKKCWYRKFHQSANTFGPWLGGTLLAWSTHYEELRDGVGQYPVGIVEDESNGLCHCIPVELICFAAVPPS